MNMDTKQILNQAGTGTEIYKRVKELPMKQGKE